MTAVIGTAALTCAGMILCVLRGMEIRRMHLPVYFIVTLLGALLMLLLGMLPVGEAVKALTADSAVNPLKILILFLSITMLSVFLDETGFFRYMAALALRHAGKNQFRLFTVLYIVVSVLTAFTSNDVIILTFTPFVCYFCRAAGAHPLPYLIGEFVAANTFSMLLEIGNPTNIYLSLAEGLTFGGYLSVMWLPTLLGGLTAYVVMLLLFRRHLRTPMADSMPQTDVTVDRPLAILGGIHLCGCTLLLALSDLLSLDMWLVALCFCVSLFVCVWICQSMRKKHSEVLLHTLRRAPWGFVPFLLSMFILVTALAYNGVTEAFAGLLGSRAPVVVYGYLSAIFCNLVNNIPMTVLFGSVLSYASLPASAAYVCVIGSNVGAFLTPIGALAGIMWSNMLKKQGVKLSYARFLLCGSAIALPALTASLLGLFLVF